MPIASLFALPAKFRRDGGQMVLRFGNENGDSGSTGACGGLSRSPSEQITENAAKRQDVVEIKDFRASQ